MNHINAPSIGQGSSGDSENLQAAQPPLQPQQAPSQYPSGGNGANAAPAPTHVPAWVQHVAERAPHLTPEVARAEAQAEHMKALAEAQREATRQEELKLEQEKEKTKREEVKQGKPAQPKPSDPNNIVTEFATMADTYIAKTDFLVEPYLPRASVVGFYGRGETAKSSLIATMSAYISHFASTLWISSEENEAKIRARHVKGVTLEDGAYVPAGLPYTLQVVKTVVRSTDAQGRALTTDFNTYEHLEAAIIKAKTALENVPLEHQPAKPLRLVVIDTAVALTTWERQAGANSDEGVKRLMSFLRAVAEHHDVTIALIGHSNKGKHEHFADSVMGATAWVNSPRISFIHAKSMQVEGHVIVRVAKSNEIPHMAEIFSVHMVQELHQFADGPKAGLMKVFPRSRVWGAQQAEELWDEVTAKPKDEDDSFGSGQKPSSAVENAVQMIVETLMTTAATELTRADVEQRLNDAGKSKPDRHRWLKVDAFFVAGHPTVELFKDPARQNLVTYRRKT